METGEINTKSKPLSVVHYPSKFDWVNVCMSLYVFVCVFEQCVFLFEMCVCVCIGVCILRVLISPNWFIHNPQTMVQQKDTNSITVKLKLLSMFHYIDCSFREGLSAVTESIEPMKLLKTLKKDVTMCLRLQSKSLLIFYI